ncbi:hypothetical protein G7Y89_g3046 [Cudoniella acicularis]|uniref:Uncharacterized protein n=1 Tax=Cudoniella acicularis TaxID=354080 RepID=A0A8H4RU26_9HELO|nr:hypothetical protein G7Y89_g3046 [Cudoniella acicularis]
MPPPIEDYAIVPQHDLYQHQLQEPNPNPDQQELSSQDAPLSPARATKPQPTNIPFLDRLRALPEVRSSIPWRPGQELGPEKAIDSPRVQQRGAILLIQRGKVADAPCTHCASGYGRFSQCITLEPWFQGACATCVFTSKGNKCSLRFQTSGTADGRALRYHSSNPEMLKSYIQQQGSDASKPPKKRKRQSEPAQMQSAVHASPSQQQLHANLSTTPDLDTLLQAQIASEETSGQSPQQTKKRKYQRKKPQENPDDAQDTSSNILVPERPTAGNGTPGWTAANAPHPAAEPINYIRPAPHGIVNMPTTEPARPDSSRDVNGPAAPVIDLLPKAKQRHIYSLVSGLQGGIDHLQRQLNLLKNSLGIDPDEPED